MNAARLFIGGVLIALMIVLAAVIWLDRSAPISVVIQTLPGRDIHVAIAGEVATPGVVVVPSGARLNDVANAAGGFTEEADFTDLNLAGRVGDGETIIIPSKSNRSSTSSGTFVVAGSSEMLININTATIQQLDTLPGIGEVLAGRIIAYREENGPFSSLEELSEVDGISSRMVDALRPLVTVGDGG